MHICVTIGTDASFCDRYRIATYAYHIRYTGARLKKSGRLIGSIEDSNEAEAKCIANALYLFKGLDIKTKWLVINTDSKTTINRYRRGSKDPIIQYITQILTELRSKGRCKIISFRHVKAHAPKKGRDKRTNVNQRCDNEARKLLIKYRKELKQYA